MNICIIINTGSYGNQFPNFQGETSVFLNIEMCGGWQSYFSRNSFLVLYECEEKVSWRRKGGREKYEAEGDEEEKNEQEK